MQLVGERDVRAVVKLRFRDIGGHMVTCHRMLQALQKACFFPHIIIMQHLLIRDEDCVGMF